VDYLSLKAAVSEADKVFTGSKISDAWQVSPGEVVLAKRGGPGLVLSINPARPGLFLLRTEELSAKLPLPFTDFLRARIKGTTVGSIHMPESGERIITISFAAVWPAKEGTPLDMVLEVMGRRSNLLILEKDRILQPLKTVAKEKSSVRPVVAGELYRSPPPRSGIPVEDVVANTLPTITTSDAGREIMENIRGLSPYTALQAVLGALQTAPEGVSGGIPEAEAIALIIREMVASCTGETGFLLRSSGKIHLSPFKPLPLGTSDTVQQYSPFSAAAAVWKGSDSSGMGEGRDEPTYLKERLLERQERIKSSLEHVDTEEERCLAHNEFRVMAEALLIHAGQIKPGSESALLPDPYDTRHELTIPLDRTKSSQENANDLFSRARRMKRGLEEITIRRKKLEKELKEIRQAMEALNDRNDTGPARELIEVTKSHTMQKGKVLHVPYRGPGRRHTVDGFTILVGKSSTDNEKVTFKAAGPNDLWLHARDYQGAHVVILVEKRQVPDKVLYTAAALAAKGSGAKNDTAPEIMVTERKWVRKLKGGKPGKVTVERFRTIRPRTDSPKSKAQRPKGKDRG
jgi:predicted ribosome quality control (RQC) complex YloA/Tae2 family protein